jgi:uncharacterized Zn finger protein (UPF0148 family)
MREVRIDRLVKLQLKYCEACGTLALRPEGAGVYCAQCQCRMDIQAARGRKRTPGRQV